MDRSKLIHNQKVQASTILEVLISMVIIITVFGIAMMIYTNVVRMSLSIKKIKAQAILEEILLNNEQSKNIVTYSMNVDDFRIEQEVKPFNNDTVLNTIKLTAYDANQQAITNLQKVIIKK